MTGLPIYTPKQKPPNFFDYLQSHIRTYVEDPTIVNLALTIGSEISETTKKELPKLFKETIDEVIGTGKTNIIVTKGRIVESQLPKDISIGLEVKLSSFLRRYLKELEQIYKESGITNIHGVAKVREIYTFTPVGVDTVERIELFVEIFVWVDSKERRLFVIELRGKVTLDLLFKLVDVDEPIYTIEVKEYRYSFDFPF